MCPPSSGSRFLLGADEQARILRSFLISLAATPLLLSIESARRIVSLEATLAAIALGMLLGIVAAVGLADVTSGCQQRDGIDCSARLYLCDNHRCVADCAPPIYRDTSSVYSRIHMGDARYYTALSPSPGTRTQLRTRPPS